MKHRAERIIDAVASMLEQQLGPRGYHVYKHRRQSFDPQQDELPALTVNFGPDEALPSGTGVWNSRLQVLISAIAATPSEPELMQQLFKMRADSHIALMEDPYLGLDFVIGLTYDGASEPEHNGQTELYVGVLTSSWLVDYQMPEHDPTSA